MGWCKIYNQMAEDRKDFAFTNMLFTKVAHPATKSNNFGLIQNSKYFQIFTVKKNLKTVTMKKWRKLLKFFES